MLSGLAFAADSVPIESVKALAALDNNGGWRPIFDNTPTPLMRRYFSPAFNQAWAAAMKHNKDFPVFDADPLTGEQNGGGIKSVSAKMEAPNRVAAKMTLHDGSERSVEFLMIHSAAGEWFINDIIYPHQKSLRVVLGEADRWRAVCGALALSRFAGIRDRSVAALATRERSATAPSGDPRMRCARSPKPARSRLAQEPARNPFRLPRPGRVH
jgi:hypothetical protein